MQRRVTSSSSLTKTSVAVSSSLSSSPLRQRGCCVSHHLQRQQQFAHLSLRFSQRWASSTRCLLSASALGGGGGGGGGGGSSGDDDSTIASSNKTTSNNDNNKRGRPPFFSNTVIIRDGARDVASDGSTTTTPPALSAAMSGKKTTTRKNTSSLFSLKPSTWSALRNFYLSNRFGFATNYKNRFFKILLGLMPVKPPLMPVKKKRGSTGSDAPNARVENVPKKDDDGLVPFRPQYYFFKARNNGELNPIMQTTIRNPRLYGDTFYVPFHYYVMKKASNDNGNSNGGNNPTNADTRSDTVNNSSDSVSLFVLPGHITSLYLYVEHGRKKTTTITAATTALASSSTSSLTSSSTTHTHTSGYFHPKSFFEAANPTVTSDAPFSTATTNATSASSSALPFSSLDTILAEHGWVLAPRTFGGDIMQCSSSSHIVAVAEDDNAGGNRNGNNTNDSFSSCSLAASEEGGEPMVRIAFGRRPMQKNADDRYDEHDGFAVYPLSQLTMTTTTVTMMEGASSSSPSSSSSYHSHNAFLLDSGSAADVCLIGAFIDYLNHSVYAPGPFRVRNRALYRQREEERKKKEGGESKQMKKREGGWGGGGGRSSDIMANFVGPQPQRQLLREKLPPIEHHVYHHHHYHSTSVKLECIPSNRTDITNTTIVSKGITNIPPRSGRRHSGRVVVPDLENDKGIALALVCATHGHPDHAGGAWDYLGEGGLRGRGWGRWWWGGVNLKQKLLGLFGASNSSSSSSSAPPSQQHHDHQSANSSTTSTTPTPTTPPSFAVPVLMHPLLRGWYGGVGIGGRAQFLTDIFLAKLVSVTSNPRGSFFKSYFKIPHKDGRGVVDVTDGDVVRMVVENNDYDQKNVNVKNLNSPPFSNNNLQEGAKGGEERVVVVVGVGQREVVRSGLASNSSNNTNAIITTSCSSSPLFPLQRCDQNKTNRTYNYKLLVPSNHHDDAATANIAATTATPTTTTTDGKSDAPLERHRLLLRPAPHAFGADMTIIKKLQKTSRRFEEEQAAVQNHCAAEASSSRQRCGGTSPSMSSLSSSSSSTDELIFPSLPWHIIYAPGHTDHMLLLYFPLGKLLYVSDMMILNQSYIKKQRSLRLAYTNMLLPTKGEGVGEEEAGAGNGGEPAEKKENAMMAEDEQGQQMFLKQKRRQTISNARLSADAEEEEAKSAAAATADGNNADNNKAIAAQKNNTKKKKVRKGKRLTPMKKLARFITSGGGQHPEDEDDHHQQQNQQPTNGDRNDVGGIVSSSSSSPTPLDAFRQRCKSSWWWAEFFEKPPFRVTAPANIEVPHAYDATLTRLGAFDVRTLVFPHGEIVPVEFLAGVASFHKRRGVTTTKMSMTDSTATTTDADTANNNSTHTTAMTAEGEAHKTKATTSESYSSSCFGGRGAMEKESVPNKTRTHVLVVDINRDKTAAVDDREHDEATAATVRLLTGHVKPPTYQGPTRYPTAVYHHHHHCRHHHSHEHHDHHHSHPQQHQHRHHYDHFDRHHHQNAAVIDASNGDSNQAVDADHNNTAVDNIDVSADAHHADHNDYDDNDDDEQQKDFAFRQLIWHDVLEECRFKSYDEMFARTWLCGYNTVLKQYKHHDDIPTNTTNSIIDSNAEGKTVNGATNDHNHGKRE